ncbi:hypothetical protein AGMMS49957_10510 [Synergistales bacterium]|nr:hypothetical protein AGMMS49957_10510 [Synergistales bacterium]
MTQNKTAPEKESEQAKHNLNRLNDRLFKYIFASEQHKENLIRFLNDVLNDPDRVIADIEYIDREIDPPIIDGKLIHFDVRAKTIDGRIFHVEVQIADENDFLKRGLFYTCSSYTTQLTIGKRYYELKEVVFVGVLNFKIFNDKHGVFHSIHKLLDVENHKCYCPDIEMHFLEIPKLRELSKSPDKMTGLERMLTYMGTVGGTEKLSQVAEYDIDIKRILSLEEKFIQNPETWVGYLKRERAQVDWEHYVEARESDAGARGMAQGITQGITQGKMETATNLLSVGVDENTISKATGLSLEEIQKLRK